MIPNDPQIESILPQGSAPKPVPITHFPDRLHAFIWRNWQTVDLKRLAMVLDTSVANIEAIGASMGLPAPQPFLPSDVPRGYITILRRNWHILPYAQLLQLVDMSAAQLAPALKEDDFLWNKLGHLKPYCEPLSYSTPGPAARQRAAQIKSVVQQCVGDHIHAPIDPRFSFVRKLSEPIADGIDVVQPDTSLFAVRFIYSYFAMFGDPLMTPQLDPYPEGLLQRLARVGVNGVWMHVVLRNLAPGGDAFPEFGDGHVTRLETLRKLVERTAKYGIAVYLYLNEPRAMPAVFFRNRSHMAGVHDTDHVAMCTSDPTVRQWISDAVAHVFTAVPGLGGVFTITASEGLTNCASGGQHAQCLRCAQRSDDEIIAEVNNTIEDAVHRVSPNAEVFAYDWGWKGHGDAPETIRRLNKRIWLMSVSEWMAPFDRGGVKSQVGEYAMSVAAPGPRAVRHWSYAARHGLRSIAKVQFNNTWELATVPYLPVMDLVATHCHRLATTGVDGMMLSWSLGGYPSPNLAIAHHFSARPTPSVAQVLDEMALERFGPDGAPHARRAWTQFSCAFGHYPFDCGVIYYCPVQLGPANLLYPNATGYQATMCGLPYDDLKKWRGPYPAEVFAEQFERVASGWAEGLVHLENAVRYAPSELIQEARAEWRYACAARLHFQSVAKQVRFTILRNQLSEDAPRLAVAEQSHLQEQIKSILDEEVELAQQMFTLVCEDSCLGFEASNQYLFLPLDLVEKIVNCRYLATGGTELLKANTQD